MINNYVVVATSQSQYITHMLHDGSSCLSRILDIPKTLDFPITNRHIIAIDGFDTKILSHDADYHLVQIENNVRAFMETIIDIATIDEQATTCITWIDNMLPYPPLYDEIFNLHTKYNAHYSFAEGYPRGISPEFLSYTAAVMFKTIIAQENSAVLSQEVTRESIFSVAELKLNDFDIEALLSKVDMRDLRLSFTADTRRNFTIAKQIIEDGVEDPNDIDAHYKNKPHRFRGVPSYIYVQVSSKDDWCLYKPEHINKNFYNEMDNFIDPKQWEIYLKKLQEFSPEAILCIGYNGEPAYHNNIGEILALSTQYFDKVYIETHGRAWHEHQQASWWKEDWMHQIIWIISLDAFSESTYELIHRKNQKDVLEFINFLYQYVDKKNIYVQSVRMTENEDELEAFMEYWNKEEVNPIIQKYNHYCGVLTQRKVIDISPIKRNACYHLARDIVMLLDGRVALCSQVMSTDGIIGDLSTEALETIWSANDEVFSHQLQDNYKDICRSCDEYYTVNA